MWSLISVGGNFNEMWQADDKEVNLDEALFFTLYKIHFKCSQLMDEIHFSC